MSKKKKTKVEPWKAAQPHILGAQNALNSAFQQNQPGLQAISSTISSKLPMLAEKAFATDGIANSAQGYAKDVLGGKFLNNNPHLESIIGAARGNAADNVNATFSRAGRTAGGAHQGILGQKLFETEAGLRYGDYEAERARMGQAAGMAPGLVAAEYMPIEALTKTAGAAAEIPYIGARMLAQGTSGLLGPYSTTTQSQGLGSSLGGLLGAGLAGWASGGFNVPKGGFL